MQTVIDHITTVFDLVNVTSVKAVIGGAVYRSKAPDNNASENIEIVSGANVNSIVQDATLFVNYHVQNTALGHINETKVHTLADILLPLLEGCVQLDIIDESLYPNADRLGWAIYSVRVRLNAFNDLYTE